MWAHSPSLSCVSLASQRLHLTHARASFHLIESQKAHTSSQHRHPHPPLRPGSFPLLLFSFKRMHTYARRSRRSLAFVARTPTLVPCHPPLASPKYNFDQKCFFFPETSGAPLPPRAREVGSVSARASPRGASHPLRTCYQRRSVLVGSEFCRL